MHSVPKCLSKHINIGKYIVCVDSQFLMANIFSVSAFMMLENLPDLEEKSDDLLSMFLLCIPYNWH